MKLTLRELEPKLQILKAVDLSKNDKLTYAIKKLFKRIDDKVNPIKDDFQELIADEKIKYASVDGSGNLIVDEQKNYKYTPENLTKLNAATNKLNSQFMDTEFEIEGYFPENLPRLDLFDMAGIEELVGLLITQEEADAIIEAL